MDRVEEIEAAIVSLPPEEYRRIVDWFRSREQTRWDEQMDRDSAQKGNSPAKCHMRHLERF